MCSEYMQEYTARVCDPGFSNLRAAYRKAVRLTWSAPCLFGPIGRYTRNSTEKLSRDELKIARTTLGLRAPAVPHLSEAEPDQLRFRKFPEDNF